MVNLHLTNLDLAEYLLSIYYEVIQLSEESVSSIPLSDGIQNRDNLIAYLALLEQNTLELSQHLENRGFASIKQSHTHVLYTFEKILENLKVPTISSKKIFVPSPIESGTIMKNRSELLLGKKNTQLQSSIMVTLDEKMVFNQALLEDLLLNGMNIARINCAHGHKDVWKQLIENLKRAEKGLKEKGKYNNKSCKIYMDLAGPKVRIGNLNHVKITVKKGDHLRLYLNSEKLAHPATNEYPAGVPITLVKAFRNVQISDPIFIDDGKISGVVQKVTKEFIEIKINSPVFSEFRIKEGKGLNLPDSLVSLNVSALTEKDIHDLPFVITYADILGVSFVHSPLDLKKLHDELVKYSAQNMAVVAKIETKDAVHQLARIIFEGLKFRSFGIMIARGDLAVEVGPENLSYVQDEILRICAASYIPVIWATGVLENLTKKGIPTRSEITDAFYGKRADCVMLNKGPYIIDSLLLLTKLLKTESRNLSKKQRRSSDLTAQYGVINSRNI
ncbi:pyruvate kinase [Bacillus sp. X1(2014)]|uniref:pyruvate kinase n=1 Tax=Bacillus sp. X1(2014) TaxID=1565991 RepID=UPI00164244C8|nr:pyruvate kinase [Bacillus sp. X1(2014)]